MGLDAHFHFDTAQGGERVLHLSGSLKIAAIAGLDAELRGEEGPVGIIDIAGVERLDTVGAWFIRTLSLKFNAEVRGGSEKAERLLSAVEATAKRQQTPYTRPDPLSLFLSKLGEQVIMALRGTVAALGFFGIVTVALVRTVKSPSRLRGRALIYQMEFVGVTALPIVGLMSILIGIVVAQQGAVQLAQFGAEAFTVNLAGRLTLRELGTLMTAIMVAGRSGSAFAAQLGTMKLTEEVDAMRTIGIAPLEALVLPRILATVFMMPLLSLYSAILAIIGAAIISDMLLNIPFWTFISRVRDVVPIYDLWVGLIKAPVYGLIIALAGCYHGLQVSGNSEEVGTRTTLAVVSAIFAVIVLNAFFAVFFTQLGWG